MAVQEEPQVDQLDQSQDNLVDIESNRSNTNEESENNNTELVNLL